MSFDVPGDDYGRFMGRWSEPLAARLADLVAAAPGATALDVGCGPGALTAVLVDRLGPDAVRAVDPSVPFVDAVRARLPGLDAQVASAESLPFRDASFDLVLAQLVVHFMADPVAGLREMARVAVPGGLVAASVWDHAGDRGPLSVFWRAVRDLDPDARDESGLAGARAGHLAALFERAGLAPEPTSLEVTVGFESHDDWWQPYTLGVGPAGAYVGGLGEADRSRLRERCVALLPDRAPFELSASAWTVTARVR